MAHTQEHTDAPVNMKKKIWVTFWILLALTLVDIVFYFMLLSNHSMAKNILFIVLGIVKAYYIVAIFMHMKFEKKVLANFIVYPMFFVIILVLLILIEGTYVGSLR